jgi:glycosyltransferase involved in cell wall biosynthesis
MSATKRILLVSYAYAPGVGGIETVSRLLVAEFVRAGHQVTVLTWTASDGSNDGPCPVVRHPGLLALLRWTAWAEVVFHNNISLTAAWPLMLLRRPWVVAHHTWIARPTGQVTWRDRLKLMLTRKAVNISISNAIAAQLDCPSTVVPNPYEHTRFTVLPGIQRDRDLVFLGRLVSDKGVDVLIAALALLQSEGLTPSCMVIGNGPEEEPLRLQALAAGLDQQITFAGVLRGQTLVEQLNRHRVLVVPSRWREPFGVVALEGIACGCVAVVSADGGLVDAAGPCGRAVANGNAPELARCLRALLTDPALLAHLRAGAEAHLARHVSSTVAQRYLEIIAQATDARRTTMTARTQT